MTVHLTRCKLSTLLTLAKEAHTRWEERYRMEGATPPSHHWEDWYATYLIARIKEEELEGTFCDGDTCSITDNHLPEPMYVSEPSEPDAL